MPTSVQWLQFGAVVIVAGGLLTGLLWVKTRTEGIPAERVARGLVKIWLCVLGYIGIAIGLRSVHGGAFVDIAHTPDASYGLSASAPQGPASQLVVVIGIVLMIALAVLAIRAVREMLSSDGNGVAALPPTETDDKTA